MVAAMLSDMDLLFYSCTVKIFEIIKRNLSALAIVIIGVTCIWNCFNETRWESTGVMSWDAACYYAYLPQFINNKDSTLTIDELQHPDMAPSNRYVTAPNGNRVIKTSMGMSFMYLPFYLAGYVLHFFSSGNSGTGMEIEYREAMQFFGTFCLLSGLLLLRSMLKKYFSEGVIALTLLIIALGTNALYYTTYEGCMSHIPDFMLFVIFLFCTQRWHLRPSLRNSIILGLLYGLIVLIRPTNILAGWLFLLYNVSNWQEMKDRIFFLLLKWPMIVVMAIATIAVWIPQMVYWYHLTGQLFFYSYGIERFFFLKPKIFYGLLGGRKGWLIYTPMAWFMLLGFIFVPRYVKRMLLPSLVLLVVFVYITFSWWCWWYGGSFGCRPIIDIYGILAFPLASLLAVVFEVPRKPAVKATFFTLLLAMISLNLFQTWQAKVGVIHYANMTYAAYGNVFLGTRPAPDSLLKDPPWGDAIDGNYMP